MSSQPPADGKNSIFISYRREDSQDATGRIYDRLTQEFSSESIFKDVDAIPYGVDFREHLEQQVAGCHVLLAIVGQRWKDNPRLQDEGDFVRIEIEHGLGSSRNILVVPVLVSNASMPTPEQMPSSMEDFAFRNAIQVRPDPDFHKDMDKLIRTLVDEVGLRKKSTATRSSFLLPTAAKIGLAVSALVILAIFYTQGLLWNSDAEKLTEVAKARNKLSDLNAKMMGIEDKLVEKRDLLCSIPPDSPPTREISRQLGILNKQVTILVSDQFGAEQELEQAIQLTRPTTTVKAPEKLAPTVPTTTPKVKSKPPTIPVKPLPAGAILASSVRVKVVRLNLFPNPVQDSLLQIYDKHELDEKFPFPFTGTILEFYDKERKIKKRYEEIKNGLYDGISIWWHANGSKQFETQYVKGAPQGKVIWWRKDGYVEYEGEWQDDRLKRAKTFNTNGAQVSQIINGTGTLIFHHPNGQKQLEEAYSHGKVSGNKFWDKHGKPVESVDPKFIPFINRNVKPVKEPTPKEKSGKEDK